MPKRKEVAPADPRSEYREIEQSANKANGVGDEKIIGELADLRPLEYERLRKEKASELGCRESVLDKLVQQKRPKIAARALQGHEVQLTESNLAETSLWGKGLGRNRRNLHALHGITSWRGRRSCSVVCAHSLL